MKTTTTQSTSDKIEQKLWDQLLKLPLLPKALANYLPVVQSGKLLYVSGQLPLENNSLGAFRGRLGREINIAAGNRAAKVCTLNALALIKQELGSLEKVKQVVKLTGYVAGMPGFSEQASVINGASDLLVALFGDVGRHARAAVGVTDLPKGACVEIEFMFEVK